MKNKSEDILKISKNYIKSMSKIIPKKIIDSSKDKNKIPFKIKSFEYILSIRIIEISNVIFLMIERKKHLPVIILIRSVMETGSILFWLDRKIKKVIETKSLDDLNTFLMKYLFGTKSIESDKENIIPYNVLKALDVVDKEIQGFRKSYEILSEYTHPNYLGAMNAFSDLNADTGILNLLLNKKIDNEIYLGPFAATLGLSFHAIEDIDKNYEEILKIC